MLKFYRLNIETRIYEDIDENTKFSDVSGELGIMTEVQQRYLKTIWEAKICAICLVSLINGYNETGCVRLLCGHAFHNNCLASIGNCPLCREVINNNDKKSCSTFEQFVRRDGSRRMSKEKKKKSKRKNDKKYKKMKKSKRT